ncbi:hypothetical protein CEXT_147721 [Caerostris extrusa]|uniref:Uncharacterized protein n=1 Tax=Caerostris extrusa TaxID=172846 RepID=A0AAV4PGK4_CAEEX|nr:hypothetical protein CEXT_147721 [Caerostris extrusa]
MECVNFLGQGRPVSQIPLTTARVAGSPSYQIWNASTFLGRKGCIAKYNWLQPGCLFPSYQIWNALTFLSRVGRLAKYNWLQPGVAVSFLSNIMRQPFLDGVGLLAKYNWLQPGWLSPSYQIWNASTLASVGRIEKQPLAATARVAVSFLSNMDCVNLLVQGRPDSQIPSGYSRVPGSCLLPIKYEMR